MPKLDELRLILKVCRYYYKDKLLQSDISKRLDISQSAISRLLKEAERRNIIKFSIAEVQGYFPEIEEKIAEKYNLREAIVISKQDDTKSLLSNLGHTTSTYLQNTISPRDLIGISCWSQSLYYAIESLNYFDKTFKNHIVQVLGGLGSIDKKETAFKMVEEFSKLTNGSPILLPAPGVVDSIIVKNSLEKNYFVKEALSKFNEISLCISGIGSLKNTQLFKKSGDGFTKEDFDELKSLNAIGHICLRFFNSEGNFIKSKFDQRVIGINLENFKKINRRVAVAGGKNKHHAIKAALKGNYINVLITDLDTAKFLIK